MWTHKCEAVRVQGEALVLVRIDVDLSWENDNPQMRVR